MANSRIRLNPQEQNRLDSYLLQNRSPGQNHLNLRNPMYVDFDYENKQRIMTQQQDSSIAKLHSDLIEQPN